MCALLVEAEWSLMEFVRTRGSPLVALLATRFAPSHQIVDLPEKESHFICNGDTAHRCAAELHQITDTPLFDGDQHGLPACLWTRMGSEGSSACLI